MFGTSIKMSEVWVSGHFEFEMLNKLDDCLRNKSVWVIDDEFTELRGISQQSDIGFLTLMEQLRYCTVGSFYKNPKNPVWVMASETHLTGKCLPQNIFINLFFFNFVVMCMWNSVLFFVALVLFSYEKNLVSKETPSEIARRVFKSYDPEGNNFIPNPLLQDVLSALELVSEPE